MSDDNKITLPAFAELVAARAKVSNAEANTYIHQLAKTIGEELESGDDVNLYHFGRFRTTHVDEQAGHDPNSGAPLTIPAHSRVHFRPYSALRFAVNAPFRQLRIRELTPEKTAWRTRTGFWILLALFALLLIILGIWAANRLSTQDEPRVSSPDQTQAPTPTPSQIQPQAPSPTPSQAPPEKSSDKMVVIPTEQTPGAIAPTIATDAAPHNHFR